MMTRAQELIDQAVCRSRAVERCHCAACEEWARGAIHLARAALLSTLRKQHLRLTYFEPERERRALLDELRILLDRSA